MRMSLEDIFLSLTTEETPTRRQPPRRRDRRMRNIVAIAQKELKSYFSSPIGYIADRLLGASSSAISTSASCRCFVRQQHADGRAWAARSR